MIKGRTLITPNLLLLKLKDAGEVSLIYLFFTIILNNSILKQYNPQVNATTGGQYPYATVLSCIDSRVSAELVFDQGIGDIFSIRIAGNFVNEDILGSMEFACKLAGTKLVVVLGHTACGAVKG